MGDWARMVGVESLMSDKSAKDEGERAKYTSENEVGSRVDRGYMMTWSNYWTVGGASERGLTNEPLVFKSDKSDKNKGRETKFTMESEVGSEPAGDPARCGWVGYRVADGASE